MSAAPFRLRKTFTGAEGSVSVPAVVKFPGQSQARMPLTTSTLVKDLLPTFLDMANIPMPTTTYAGKSIEPISGVSLRTALQAVSTAPQVRPATATFALEYLGQGYVQRADGWKLSRTAVPGVATPNYGAMPWRLFNVNDDRGETRDRAAEQPDILAELKKEWARYVLDNAVLVPATPPAAKRDPASL